MSSLNGRLKHGNLPYFKGGACISISVFPGIATGVATDRVELEDHKSTSSMNTAPRRIKSSIEGRHPGRAFLH